MTEYRVGKAMSVVGWLCYVLGSFGLVLALFTFGESLVAGTFMFLVSLLLCWAGWVSTGMYKNAVVRVHDDRIESVDLREQLAGAIGAENASIARSFFKQRRPRDELFARVRRITHSNERNKDQ